MQRRFTMKRGRACAVTAELEVIAKESVGGSNRPPLLFVHGAGHGAWCWDEHFLDYFAGHGFDSYALSLRGHGASGGRERLRWTSIADYVRDVARVASELPREPVVLGHSLGSLVVQRYLETHEAPAAVLLAPPSGSGLFRPAARMLLDHPWRSLQVILTGRASRLIGAPELARKFFFSPELAEDRVREYAARQGPESFRALLELVWTRPDRSRIRGVPLLVLGAGLDYFVRPSAIRRIAEGYGAEAKVLPGLGHGMMLDAGWREAAEAILEWLERTLEPEPPSP